MINKCFNPIHQIRINSLYLLILAWHAFQVCT